MWAAIVRTHSVWTIGAVGGVPGGALGGPRDPLEVPGACPGFPGVPREVLGVPGASPGRLPKMIIFFLFGGEFAHGLMKYGHVRNRVIL